MSGRTGARLFLALIVTTVVLWAVPRLVELGRRL